MFGGTWGVLGVCMRHGMYRGYVFGADMGCAEGVFWGHGVYGVFGGHEVYGGCVGRDYRSTYDSHVYRNINSRYVYHSRYFGIFRDIRDV